MTWIRLKKSHTDKNGKKYPIGTKWNMINPQDWVKSGKAELCDRDDDKTDSELFKPKNKKK